MRCSDIQLSHSIQMTWMFDCSKLIDGKKYRFSSMKCGFCRCPGEMFAQCRMPRGPLIVVAVFRLCHTHTTTWVHNNRLKLLMLHYNIIIFVVFVWPLFLFILLYLVVLLDGECGIRAANLQARHFSINNTYTARARVCVSLLCIKPKGLIYSFVWLNIIWFILYIAGYILTFVVYCILCIWSNPVFGAVHHRKTIEIICITSTRTQ